MRGWVYPRPSPFTMYQGVILLASFSSERYRTKILNLENKYQEVPDVLSPLLPRRKRADPRTR